MSALIEVWKRKFSTELLPQEMQAKLLPATGPLFLVLTLFLPHLKEPSLFWYMGLALSVTLSLFIMVAVYQEMASEIADRERDYQNDRQKIGQLNALIRNVQQDVEAQRLLAESFKSEKDMAIEAYHAKARELMSLQLVYEEASQKALRLEEAEQKLAHTTTLLNELNEKRVENFQLSLLHEAEQAEVQSKESELKKLKTELEKLSDELKSATAVVPLVEEASQQIELDHKQLKKQFDEKTGVLTQTRKELFQLEGKLLVLQKDSDENSLEPSPTEEALIEHIKEVEGECQSLEEQVVSLQDLISKLLVKKRASRPRKPKKETQI